MRKLALLTFLTLDGVMQAPAHPDEDRSGDFTQGGWATDYWNTVMPQVMETAMADPYDLLLGRKTYESFANHWPNIKNDPIADKLNQATKYVITSTLETLTWNNSKRITGDIASEVANLKKQTGPLLQVHGSWQLSQTLLEHDLVDELRLWIFPVTVGSGKRLFSAEKPISNLTLLKTASTPNGVLMGFYKRAS